MTEPDGPPGRPAASVAALKFRCPNDGSTAIFWDIEQGKLVCRDCRQALPDEPAPAGAVTLNGIAVSDSAERSLPEDNIRYFRCEGCGAEVVADKNTSMSATCSWCRNNLIAGDVVSTEFTPDGLIPFAISQKQAIDSFRAWVAKHWFVRKNFANTDDLIVKPVYYPFYVLDATVDISVDGHGEKVTRIYRSGDYDCTDYEKFRVQGPATGVVDDEEWVALQEVVNEKVVNLIRPFDWSAPRLRQFNYRYLNGYHAEHRDIAFQTISQSVADEGVAAITAELTTRLHTRIEPTGVHYSPVIGYVLAPVWLLTYVDSAESKTYFFAINGQNGQSAGVLPVDWVKSSIFIGACAAVMAIVGFGLEYLRLKGLAG
jgi:hypothetical protein